MDDESKIGGIELTWASEEPCIGGPTNSTNAFTAKVMCDQTNTIDGEAEILAVDVSNTCNPVVTLQHDSGCPIMERDFRGLRLMRLLIPLIALVLVISLCIFMCCCCIRSRRARKEQKERELREGNQNMPIEAQHASNTV